MLATLGAASLATGAQAQTAPDAGSLLRQQPRPPATEPATAPAPAPAATAAQAPETGPRVLINAFRIRGAQLISEAELQAQLRDLVGKELGFRQLEGAAATLSAHYARRGYLARVFAPPQQIESGVLTLEVIEGRRGGVRVNATDPHIDASRVAGFIDHRLGRGDTFDLHRLGEALNVLNEQPGLAVRSALATGQAQAEVDITVTATAKPWLTGQLGVSNQGSTSTGEAQLGGSLVLSNLSGHLDAVALTANLSEGSAFGRLDYGIAVGHSGLRVGLNASQMHYRVVQPALAALESRGDAGTAGVVASLPLARRNGLSLGVLFNADSKRLVDRTVVGETSRRRVQVAGLALDGQLDGVERALWAPGMLQFDLGLTVGDSDQANAGALAADAAARQVQGRFNKLSASLSYLQTLAGAWRVSGALRGQLADKNLDSTERFSLGGPNGVRAYPVGEGTGDQGWIGSADLVRQLNEATELGVFLDHGRVQLNHRTWAGWNAGQPALDNRYALSAAGLTAVWRPTPQATLRATLARALGRNPGADASGHNADGAAGRTRAWIHLYATF
ncbi:ShlB/FhaC/HecB family hemolysin secretion/activation protein [Aquabacterium sp. OR-4]|uniref:ShlB/FhaC/HecB family hemolysin secretion/activation protein n=1 Tax=Aquabacterium sp. OR-4 TaxID=2978127 RepID=UPI0028C605AC|nr:ShlB/FhaC/HecB family hemolysin secretion/activation protein [Aquabacterium sp. OR-4]MDT7834829.1 ShlB/FhaC/HecB family hemolysin secretion/activation protein [Aquabacterium sp. OR-4]